MRVLLTGAGGFLGRAIASRLLAQSDVELRCQVRQAKSADALRNAVAGTVPHGNRADSANQLEIIQANLLSHEDTARVVSGTEIIIHAAAAMRGAPADMYLNTVVATRNLLDATTAAGTRRVVLISSLAVYRTHDLRSGTTLDERTPLESHPQFRDGYAIAKLHQEELAHEWATRTGRELVVLRPGVVYGPGGGGISNRVGINAFGWFANLGGSNELPLSFVDNCADAVLTGVQSAAAAGKAFNVHDDDLPTCGEFLAQYKREVGGLRSIRVPYWALMLLSRALQWYHHASKGQLPAVFTPYVTRTVYRSRHHDNGRLKFLGWKPVVTTEDGMRRTFAYLKGERERATAARPQPAPSLHVVREPPAPADGLDPEASTPAPNTTRESTDRAGDRDLVVLTEAGQHH